MTLSRRILLEIAITSADDARIAQANGADRLELCSALSLGGLTPSLGTIRAVRQASHLPLLVLIRPRPAGFAYSETEFVAMCHDTALALEAGADGIVTGVLTNDGEVDLERCEKMRRLVNGYEAVFHRAFDVVPDPDVALEQIFDLGFARILTSGQEATGLKGAARIRRSITASRGRIQILPGGGINRETVRELVTVTGCDQVHASLRTPHCDRSTARRPAVYFGSLSARGEGLFDGTDATAVRTMRAILDELAEGSR